MLTPNTRDEVTLIFLKHKYLFNFTILLGDRISDDTRLSLRAENKAIRATFEEVREKNTLNMQGGTYEEIAKLCDEFLESIAVLEEK